MSETTVASGDNPFVGPRSFETGEHLFGRDREAQELFGLLVSERTVLVHAPSGAGKTSLLQASMIPRLREEGFRVWPMIRVNAEPLPDDRPSDGPGPGSNRHVLSALRSLEKGLPEDRAIPPEVLRAMTLSEFFDGFAPRGMSEEQVLIFDQFEEILTVAPNDLDAKREFFDQLGSLMRATSLYTVFSLRDEFVGALEPFRKRIPRALETHFRLDLLGPRAAREAVTGPSGESAVTFSDEAATILVDNLRVVKVRRGGMVVDEPGPFVEPVQLQVVCYRLWEQHRDAGRIDESSVRGEAGDVDAALAGYYADRIARIRDELRIPERKLRDWCEDRLITPQKTRGQLQAGDEAEQGLSQRAVDALIDARLVRAEERRGMTWYELAHDRMIGPLRQSNDEWRKLRLQPFQFRAADWERDKRTVPLLDEADLPAAESWADAHPDELSPAEREFLLASKKAREEAERGRKMEEARLEAEETRRGKRQMAALAVAAVLGAFAAVVVAMFMYHLSTKASESANKEKVARDNAEASRKLAEKEGKRADARRLAAQSLSRLDDKPDLAALLALEARKIDDETDGHASLESMGSLLHVVENSPRLMGVRRGDKEFVYQEFVSGVAFSPDGNTLAAVGDDSTIFLYDLSKAKAPDEPRRIPDVDDRPSRIILTCVAFSPDGKTIAAGSNKNTVILYDSASLKSVGRPLNGRAVSPGAAVGREASDREARAVTFRPSDKDGTVLAWAAGPDVILFDRAIGRPQVLSKEDDGDVNGLAFSPDGNTLAAADSDRNVIVRSVNRDRNVLRVELKKTLPHDNIVNEVAFSPDGETLATGGWEGTIHLWKHPSLEPRGRLYGHSSVIDGLAFSRDGKTLASASWDRSILLWDVADAAKAVPREGPILGHSDFIVDLAFASADDRLATASWDGTARLWDAHPHRRRGRPIDLSDQAIGRFERRAIRQLAIAWDDKTMAFVLEKKGVMVKKGRDVVPVLDARAEGIDRVSFDADGATLAVPAEGGGLLLWDVAEGRARDAPIGLEDLWGKSAKLRSAVFSPVGKRIATIDDDGVVRIADLSGKIRASTLPKGHIRSLAFDGDGRRLVTGDADGEVAAWDVTAGARPIGLPPEERHHGWIWSVAFHDDRQTIATGGSDGIGIWSLADGGPLRHVTWLLRDREAVRSVAFRPVKSIPWLVSGGESGLVSVWASSDGGWQPIGPPLQGHNPETWFGSVAPSAAPPLTASRTGLIRRASSAAPAPLAMAPGGSNRPRNWVWCVAFSPGGNTMYSAGDGAIILGRDAEPETWSDRAHELAGRDFSRDERRSYRILPRPNP